MNASGQAKKDRSPRPPNHEIDGPRKSLLPNQHEPESGVEDSGEGNRQACRKHLKTKTNWEAEAELCEKKVNTPLKKKRRW